MNRIIDKLAWLEVKEGRILVARSKEKNTFYIPGGKREPGETDHMALIREIEEELTVLLLPESLEYYGTFKAQAHGREAGILVKMTCYTGSFSGNLKPSSEIEEIGWFHYHQKEQVSPVDKLIFDDLKSKGFL